MKDEREKYKESIAKKLPIHKRFNINMDADGVFKRQRSADGCNNHGVSEEAGMIALREHLNNNYYSCVHINGGAEYRRREVITPAK